MSKVTTPETLSTAGRTLWDSVTDTFELDDKEAIQLEEACRVRDTISDLRAQLQTDGIMLSSSQGSRLHPAVAEIRSQQLVLARLLATLQIPTLEEDELPASSGVRGVYALSASARGARNAS